MMTTLPVEQFVDWIGLHPGMAWLAVFLISFGESVAVVGLIVPGAVLLFAVGALLATGVVGIVPTLLWGSAGAIAGDTLSFWLGHHFRDGVRTAWPLRTHPAWLQRGESFFLRHGGKSILIGRFVGPVRPFIPLVAGMLGMSSLRFLLIDVPAGLAWAPAYILPGMLVGESVSVLGHMKAKSAVAVALILSVLALVAWGIRRVSERGRARAARR